MKNENNQKKTIPITSIPTPSIWSRMLIGGVSASIAQTFCHPIETIKVRLQNETKCTQKIYKNFPNTARVIIRNEGLFGLWRGMAPSLIREMSYSSLRFGLFVPIRNLIDQRFNNYTNNITFKDKSIKNRPNFMSNFLAGGITGAIGSFVSSPADLLKTKMQYDSFKKPKTLSHQISTIYREEGFRGFWRGVGMTVTRAVVLGSVKLGTYAHCKDFVAGNRSLLGINLPIHHYFQKNQIPNIIISSIMSGLCVALTTSPVDFCRTRLMTAKDFSKKTGKPTEFKNGLDVVIKTLKNEGPRAFYRGFLPQWYRFAPYAILQFTIWEQLSTWYGISTT